MEDVIKLVQEKVDRSKIKDIRYWNRYLKLISGIPERTKTSRDGLERHHILPKSIYPQYAKSRWNIVLLTGREHYLVHWMLAKCFKGKMLFAFNQMRRVAPTGILYEYARDDLSRMFSELNRGKSPSAEMKEHLSKVLRDRVTVTDGSGKYFRVSVHDEKYRNGEYRHTMTGKMHSDETKRKMRENNGIKGKNGYHDEHGKITYLSPDFLVPESLTRGLPDRVRKKLAEVHKNSIFVVEKSTGRQVRIKENEFDEVLYDRKRLYSGEFRGFKKINENVHRRHLDLKQKKSVFLYENEAPEPWQIKMVIGCEPERIEIGLIDDKVLVTKKNVSKYINFHYGHLGRKRKTIAAKRDGLVIMKLADYEYKGEIVWTSI